MEAVGLSISTAYGPPLGPYFNETAVLDLHPGE